jgi:predicted enzyme related to lactoylglutathione lyase
MIDLINFYRVDDLDKVKHFYGDILRLPLYKDQGQCLIYCVEGHGKLGFCTHHPKQFNDNTCITFVYETKDDVDRMYTHLKHNLKNIEPPKTNKDFHIYHFYVKDFNGLTLEFQMFKK